MRDAWHDTAKNGIEEGLLPRCCAPKPMVCCAIASKRSRSKTRMTAKDQERFDNSSKPRHAEARGAKRSREHNECARHEADLARVQCKADQSPSMSNAARVLWRRCLFDHPPQVTIPPYVMSGNLEQRRDGAREGVGTSVVTTHATRQKDQPPSVTYSTDQGRVRQHAPRARLQSAPQSPQSDTPFAQKRHSCGS